VCGHQLSSARAERVSTMVIGGGLAKESGTLDLDAERDERNDRTKGSDKRFGGRDEAHVGAAQIGACGTGLRQGRRKDWS
jgi:hypothetical protein